MSGKKKYLILQRSKIMDLRRLLSVRGTYIVLRIYMSLDAPCLSRDFMFYVQKTYMDLQRLKMDLSMF